MRVHCVYVSLRLRMPLRSCVGLGVFMCVFNTCGGMAGGEGVFCVETQLEQNCVG